MSNEESPAIDPPEQAGDAGFAMRRREHDQPSLFPTEDLIIPATLQTMRKAVSAIHATPIKAEHSQSLNNLRLFDACILIAQIDFRKRGKDQIQRVKDEGLTPMFETRVTDLVRLAGIPGKNYTRIYAELENLFDMKLNWNIVGEDAQVEWEMRSHFLGALGYGKGHKRGLIRFSIEPSILHIVLEPSNWATLSLQAMEGLGTAASYALYQNAWRYIGTHQKVTAALPTATWIELLMGKSRYVSEDANGEKRVVGYGDFKRRVLMDAIARVNEISALSYTLELKELKSGTRVSKLQFKFVPKKSMGLGIPLLWPSDVVTVLNNLGFTQKEIEDLSEIHAYEDVADSILKLKEAEFRLKALGRPITSKKSYFTGILANVTSGSKQDVLDHERIEAEAKAQEAQRAAELRNERLLKEFGQHQSTRFSGNLFDLSEADISELLAKFEASPEYSKARLLAEKGWSPKNVGALSILKQWVLLKEPVWASRLLPNPEDVSFEAWMQWRLDSINS